MEVVMATPFHFHSHPSHSHPIRWFALEHPYAPDWAIVAAATLAALVLWILNA
jgi:hypothetical protein